MKTKLTADHVLSMDFGVDFYGVKKSEFVRIELVPGVEGLW